MLDGLGAVFFFASLIAFSKWRESGHSGWQAASVFLFAAAMFTKETMVFIPVLIAAYLCLTPVDCPAAGRIARILRILLPYGVVWVVYMAIRHQVIKPARTPSNIFIQLSHSAISGPRLTRSGGISGTSYFPGD